MNRATREKLDYMHRAVVAMQRRTPKGRYRPRLVDIESLRAECLKRLSPAMRAYLQSHPQARLFPY